MRFGFLTTLTIALLLPVAASAQALGGLGNTDIFTVSVTPQYPQPGSPAILSFLSSTIDLSNATLTVLVGGKQTYQGSVQPVSVILGKAGDATSISVKISSADTSYSKSLVLQPQDISLIAEPLSSAPVLYLGKPFVPFEGNTRIVAIANMVDTRGITLDPAALSYSWSVDGVQIANSSGIGKSAVIVASPLQYRLRTVSVVVQSQTGTLVGGASLSLNPKESSVRLYENDPLLGIRFDHALSGIYAINETEVSLYGAPFSLPLMNGVPVLQWFLNGSLVQTGSFITLRPSGSGKGNASLSFTASALTSSTATTNLSLSFAAKQNLNFFGL